MERFFRRVAERLKRGLHSVSERSAAGPATSIAEVTPCAPRYEDSGEARLNLLLPSINAGHYFGGIHTAVQFYRHLSRHFGQSRIVLLDAAPDAEALARFKDHIPVTAESVSTGDRQLLPFNDRYGRTLPVRSGDVWLCTAWWTAYAAQRLSSWQQCQYGRFGRVAYVIQDFEPGFYPWSSHSAMALSTYRPHSDLAVFNTGLLAEHFESSGLSYDKSWVFEPTLNEGLRPALEALRVRREPRQRRIVVYARPSTPRNAFELLCEGLRAWGWSDPAAASWEVVAVGELARDIDLGPCVLRALGKLSLADYGELLSTSAIGVSLMISPHPSYPPLEMGAFGMGVITNAFSGKELANWTMGLRSFRDLSPEPLAHEIRQEIARWEAANMEGYPPLAPDHPFLGNDRLSEIADEVSTALHSIGGQA